MARIIKSNKRGKRSTAPAKVERKARRARRSAMTVYRSARRAAGIKVTKKDVILAVAGAGAGSIGGSILVQKIPVSDARIKNAILAAAGGVVTYYGVKKKNMAITGAGMGMATVGATGLITAFIPTSTATVSGPFVRSVPRIAPATMAGPFTRSSAAKVRNVRAFADEEAI